MEAEEGTRKRKFQEFLSNDDFVDLRSEEHNTTALSLEQKRRRFNEDSKIIKDDDIEARYYHQRMKLDLELNLSPSLIDLNHHDIMSDDYKDYEEDKKKKTIEKGLVLGQQITFNDDLNDDDDDGYDHGEGAGGGGGGGSGGSKDEMVARVCMKCHMFVMLCKAIPVCPNCKFMHSPKDTSLSLSFTSKSTLIA